MTPRFPRGPQAAQQRYIAAFEALTKRICSPAIEVEKDIVIRTIEDYAAADKKWWEMFNVITRDDESEEQADD